MYDRVLLTPRIGDPKILTVKVKENYNVERSKKIGVRNNQNLDIDKLYNKIIQTGWSSSSSDVNTLSEEWRGSIEVIIQEMYRIII